MYKANQKLRSKLFPEEKETQEEAGEEGEEAVDVGVGVESDACAYSLSRGVVFFAVLVG